MERARLMADWDRTSSLLAMIRNVNRGKGQVQKKPSAFNPLRQQNDGIRVTSDNISALKALVPKRRKRRKKHGRDEKNQRNNPKPA